MRTLAVALLCLATIGHGQQSALDDTSRHMKDFAMLLLSMKPESAFTAPGARFPASNPTQFNRPSVQARTNAPMAGWLDGDSEPSEFTPDQEEQFAELLQGVEKGSETYNYMMRQGLQKIQESRDELAKFKGLHDSFDGGDSGGGVVGDGNMDLEDQHNSATLGALRGGLADVMGLGPSKGGPGRVMTMEDAEFISAVTRDEVKVESEIKSRDASAKGNYYGKTTGYAEYLIDNMKEQDVYMHRIDKVRCQQIENYMNQRELHRLNQLREVGFEDELQGNSYRKPFDAQDFLSNPEQDEDQDFGLEDITAHAKALGKRPAARLDGQAWEAFTYDDAEFQGTQEMEKGVLELKIDNIYPTFAPFQVGFAPGSHPSFTVTPDAGTMDKRGRDPVELTVRFKPDTFTFREGEMQAMLVFETEDFKKSWHLIGKPN